jgi:acetyl-CoA carboxylase biotin carboxyl carrier protein
VEAPAPTVSGNIVKSPIVGTFYAAPAPDKPPFVTVGSQVKKGDVLFIIESMKLMNEVTSDYDGTVREIYAQNGGVVEYGQAVMRVES